MVVGCEGGHPGTKVMVLLGEVSELESFECCVEFLFVGYKLYNFNSSG